MPPRERGEGGTYVQTIEPEHVLGVFDDVRGPVVTTADVADALGCSSETARRKLNQLVDDGRLAKRKTAGRVIYWRTDDDTAGAADRELEERERESAPAPEPSETPSRAGDTDSTDALDAVDFPAGRDREACVAAVYAARDYLQEHGRAPMRELVSEVMPEHSLGYDVPDLEPGERYRGAWWRRVVRPGLQALDDVESPAGGGDWRFVGD